MQSFHRPAKQQILFLRLYSINHGHDGKSQNPVRIPKDAKPFKSSQNELNSNGHLSFSASIQHSQTKPNTETTPEITFQNALDISRAEQLSSAVVVHSLTLVLAVRRWLRTCSC